jgi:dihydroxy-acid dehydratase
MVDSVEGESTQFRTPNYTNTDCRSHGFVVGHVVPEAQVGGPIALVQDGDIITIDAEANTLDVNVSEEEFARRKETWVAPPLRPKQGALLKYARLVTDASRGCVTDW